jgi:uncharacterized protein YciI
LRAGDRLAEEQLHAADHKKFIDSLIDRNVVLLGGGFAEPIDGDAHAAYVLRCNGLDEARRIAESDPFVANSVLQAELTEWQLVGINPEAIDPAAVVLPP